jgi:Domain of unknown function (DUF4149)
MRVALVLWAGSLWATAIWFAPVLFRILPDRRSAGVVAGVFFRIETILTALIALLAAALLPRSAWRTPIYLAALVLALNELVVRAWMTNAQRQGSALGLSFGAWHGVSACIYLAACAAALMWWWRVSPAE